MLNNIKLPKVLEISQDRYCAKITLKKLRELVESGCISIDLSEDVPYYPLEPKSEISLGVDAKNNSLRYDKDSSELILDDSKFDVIDGRIRLISFMKDPGKISLEKEVTLHISTYSIENIPQSFH